MSRKKNAQSEEKIKRRIPRAYILAIGIVLVICIAIIARSCPDKAGAMGAGSNGKYISK